MQDVFTYFENLIAVKMNTFDTSKTMNMRGIFYHWEKLKYVNFSYFRTPSINDASIMFENFISLIYLDLSSFTVKNANGKDGIFSGVNNNIKMCIKDENTRNYLTGSRNDYADNCFKKYIKIDLSSNICIENCNQCSNKYEYYNLCFSMCPENTYVIINEFLCFDKKPKGFYFERSNRKYNQCYIICKDCNKKGNQMNNNCLECKEVMNF